MDVDANELDKIEVENPKDSNNCLVKMLKKWVKMVQPKPSWSTVIEALKGIQENQRAETIHKLIGHATQTS